MIKVENLQKRFGDVRAVSDVSFSASPGDIVGFLGPNGAGKTTTLRILSTFLPADSGTAVVAGFDTQQNPSEVRKRIGYLPEHPPLYKEMTVEEYLRFVASIKDVPRKQMKTAIEEVLERCFITEVSNKLCGHLSRGYRQRVGIAQAIIHKPEVVILDEPTSGLDPQQIVDIRDLIGAIGSQQTVLLSTHILSEVSMVCNKVVVISRGNTVLEQTVEEAVEGRSLEEVYLDCVSKQPKQQNRMRAV